MWDAIDGLSVRLVFLIGGPSDAPSKYLKLLSALTQSLRDEARRSQLLQVQTVEEVMSVFQESSYGFAIRSVSCIIGCSRRFYPTMGILWRNP